MTESNTDKNLSSIRERFKMDPPDNTWSSLTADLEKKQAAIYRQRGNRFKLLSIGLALLLISFTTYYIYTSRPVAQNNKKEATIINAESKAEDRSESLSSSGSGNSDNAVKNNAAQVLKGGLGAWDLGRKSLFPRPLSIVSNGATTSVSNSTDKNSVAKNDIPGQQNNVVNRTENNVINESADNSFPSGITDKRNNSTTNEEGNSADKDHTNVQNHPDVQQEDRMKNSPVAPVLAVPAQQQALAGKDSLLKYAQVNSRWSLDVFYSPNYYSKNHLEADNTYYGNNPSDYTMRERPDYSYSTGFSLRYSLSKHWLLSVGATYSTIAYSITLPVIYASYASDAQLHYMYPTSCGNIEMPNQGTVLHYGDSINQAARCKQVVKFVSIPVTARFQATKNRFTFFVDGGLSVNIVQQEQADIQIGSTETLVTNNVDGLKKMNYGYLAGVGVEYAFSNGLGIFAEPMFKGSINSLTNNTSFYCYPLSFGVNTGLSLHF